MIRTTTRDNTYCDLDLDFKPHPTTKDVLMKTDEEAIKRSLRNLIYTNFYERPFQAHLGSGIYQLLFEPLTPLTQTYLKNAIEEVIRNYEPRVRVDLVKVTSIFDRISEKDIKATDAYNAPDSTVDDHTFEVTIRFTILSTMQPVVTSLFLERIR